MVTPTYRPGVEWSAGHMSEFVEAAGAWMRRQGHRFVYAWVAELQERGAVHFHLLIWLPAGVFFPRADARGWWPHGTTRTTRCDRPIGYLTKYASKLEQKEGAFPRGLRLHGQGGLNAERREVRSWLMLPSYVRDHFERAARVRRIRGGFVSLESGEFLRSEWELVDHAIDWSWIVFQRRAQL
jgi:hypothetical protein